MRLEASLDRLLCISGSARRLDTVPRCSHSMLKMPIGWLREVSDASQPHDHTQYAPRQASCGSVVIRRPRPALSGKSEYVRARSIVLGTPVRLLGVSLKTYRTPEIVEEDGLRLLASITRLLRTRSRLGPGDRMTLRARPTRLRYVQTDIAFICSTHKSFAGVLRA